MTMMGEKANALVRRQIRRTGHQKWNRKSTKEQTKEVFSFMSKNAQ